MVLCSVCKFRIALIAVISTWNTVKNASRFILSMSRNANLSFAGFTYRRFVRRGIYPKRLLLIVFDFAEPFKAVVMVGQNVN